MKWNIVPRSVKRAKKGSDFITFTFNNSVISYPCYMSNATKLRSDSSNWNQMEYSAKKGQED